MCGIAGFWKCGVTAETGVQVASLMARALRHRGPDDDGCWVDPAAGIALAHRRLSIIDLSPSGRQPMRSPSGRYVTVFNGEIYNHARLRPELAPHTPLHGHSDTEVMLAAIEQWGLQGALRRFIGMFALALWDQHRRTLHLIRDRLGVKPLYYGVADGALIFGSELKALVAYPGFRAEIDRDALALFMRHNFIPAPHSIYRGISKLMPGTVLSLSSPDDRPMAWAYWSASNAFDRRRDAGRARDHETMDEFELLLKDAVRLRMEADVTAGAFLSGGIDSSLVSALMQANSPHAVKTFSLGVTDAAYDEAGFARAVAEHLGTEHTEVYVSPQQLVDVVPELPWLYDEPFADSSQIPTLVVSRLARQEVKIVLSGDGGDELFAGYSLHRRGPRLWKRLRAIPWPMRAAVSRTIAAIPQGAWDHGARAGWLLLPAALSSYGTPGYKLHKFADVLAATTVSDMRRGLVSHWRSSDIVLTGSGGPEKAGAGRPPSDLALEAVDQIMYEDLTTYLPDDILTKVDRASMAFGLEARLPLLDHRVVEFACALPLDFKIRDGEQKWLLRRVLERHVPTRLTDRPKAGFSVPLGAWLRGPLRDWAEDLLDARRLGEQGLLNAPIIRKRWAEHVSGRHDWQHHLWDVLMFQAWLLAASSPGPPLRVADGACRPTPQFAVR